MAFRDRISITSQASISLSRIHTVDVYPSTTPELQRKLRWVLRYVIYATILWIIIASAIVLRNDDKRKLFQKSKYIKSCCKCWSIANATGYEGPQLEFSHCVDDGCSCNICNDNFQKYINSTFVDNNNTAPYDHEVQCSELERNYTGDKTTIFPKKPTADKGCYLHLSTSSFNLPIKKGYNLYGYFAIAICTYHIILLWLYLAIYRSINVGILFFVHSIVNGEICFYCLLKSYQFQANDDNCFQSIIKTETDTIIWQYVSYSIIFHVILQYAFSCSRSCFNKCKTGKNLYQFLGKIVVMVTFLCMMFSLGVYLWVCYLLKDNYTVENRTGIIVVSVCIFLATIGILPFPFCREVTVQVLESWDCLFYRFKCFRCCCQRARARRHMETYAESYGQQYATLLLENLSDSEDDEL